MKIQKVELIGFKSFVDRTIIHIDHDVIGIVGPNGCGKSNIIDAIRWCMGEQSAKHLRGKSMEDVLFGGSESRAATDMAEVTLTFENDTPGELPPEHAEYAEIAVSRRLYRTGESEYLINKTPVRLKDVTDLFLGTGIGTKAYSIVEQGRIGLIVSAKPEDRRLLIEEAAGITKYKSRKRQAERKMELTQQNLLRVGDIVAEIERSLESLKRQAQKAKRYITYRSELEDLQLTEAAHKFLELTGWLKHHGSQVMDLGDRASETRTALTAREAELEAARLDAHGAEETLEKAQNESFARSNDVRAEEAAIQRARDRIEGLKRAEAMGDGELLEQHAQQERAREERDGFMAHVSMFETEEQDRLVSTSREEDRLAEVASDLAAREAALVELRGSAGRAESEIAAIEARLLGFDARRAELLTRIERTRLQKEDAASAVEMGGARVRAVSSQLDDLRVGKVTTAEEHAALEACLSDLKAAIAESERALESSKSELERSRSRLQALLEMQARLDGVGAGTKALVETRDPAIVGLVADCIEAPAELTAALAGLLGARLEDVVVRDAERGLDLLAGIEGKGRATIVPLHPTHVAGSHDPLPEMDGVIGRLADRLRHDNLDALVRTLVGDAVVVRDSAAMLAVRAHVHSAPIVTLSGTVLWPDGRIAGGAGDSVAAGLLETKRETRELGEHVAQLETNVGLRVAAHQSLRSAIVETQAKLEAARKREHASDLELVTCEKDLRSAEMSLEQAEARVLDLDRDTAELSAAIDAQADERASTERSLEIARETVAMARERIEEGERERLDAAQCVDVQRATVTHEKVQLAGAREKLGAARETVARLERGLAEQADRVSKLEAELAETARQFGETAAELALRAEAREIALDRNRDAEDALAKARSTYETIRAALLEQEAHIKDLRARADDARDALAQAEMALREKEIELDHLLGGVADKFRGLQLPRVIGDYHLRPALSDEARERIAELAGLIDRMGSVNLDAVNEHEEAEKRFTFYTTQKADLDKALADLMRAIQQMNRESKRLFTETFDAVNAKFQEIFPKMFRGGRASLRLTNPEDMLETGIDILAQPPGKKLNNIELMSGGEKALTAVSLIFAIFQVKPSPFCILDEVDAPLDEANVARYNEMIREMTDRSQFILVTHVKRTMQLTDVLYGVTMQEPGVSRMVSVNMKGAEELTTPAPRRHAPERLKKATTEETAPEIAPDDEAQVA